MDQPEDFAPGKAVDAYYHQRLSEGILSVPQCLDCGKLHFYPRVSCPYCHSFALRWTTPSGRGVVYSTTVVRRKNGDYNVALIDLEEGPRMMSRVVDIEPDRVAIGMPVEAGVRQEGDQPLLIFVPGRSTSGAQTAGKDGRS
ncbi:Zn-ribbon domain-containing OB-fold protein [Streptomyces shenzhenensis]|uniref:Zn-ribbon domain-containing OB-fold protein n=1 Tax=Streptomyces shenzhenensis TaxID=943815 RepID=UPI00340BB871